MSEGSAISVISSSAAIGWQDHIKTITGLLETKGFDAAVEWLTEHEKKWSWSGYAYSKYIITDMYAKAVQGMKAEEAVRWAEGELKKIYES